MEPAGSGATWPKPDRVSGGSREAKAVRKPRAVASIKKGKCGRRRSKIKRKSKREGD